MNKPYKNLCVRCGTERVLLRTYEEKIGTSIVITNDMICPNKECQKKVDQDNKKQRDKNILMRLRSEQRAINRKAANKSKRAA